MGFLFHVVAGHKVTVVEPVQTQESEQPNLFTASKGEVHV